MQIVKAVMIVRTITKDNLTRAFILQVVDKLPTGEPVVIGLILRRYVVSQLCDFFRDSSVEIFGVHLLDLRQPPCV